MKSLSGVLLFALPFVLATPVLAQTAIGGGACSSSTLSGSFAITITGRQVTSSGNFSSVFQANGTASFDGLSKVTLSLTADTIGAVGMPLTWSGNYTMQSNCIGTITITTGGSALLNLVAYDNGASLLATGSDSTFYYSASGTSQPTGCSASTLSGVYSFNGSGYALSSGAVSGLENAVGLLQFDGQSGVTVNVSVTVSGKSTVPLTLTGPYSISANCLGSATLTDSAHNTYVLTLSVFNTSAANGGFDTTLSESAKFLMLGAGHAIFGQPATSTTAAAPATQENENE